MAAVGSNRGALSLPWRTFHADGFLSSRTAGTLNVSIGRRYGVGAPVTSASPQQRERGLDPPLRLPRMASVPNCRGWKPREERHAGRRRVVVALRRAAKADSVRSRSAATPGCGFWRHPCRHIRRQSRNAPGAPGSFPRRLLWRRPALQCAPAFVCLMIARAAISGGTDSSALRIGANEAASGTLNGSSPTANLAGANIKGEWMLSIFPTAGVLNDACPAMK